MRLDGNIKDTKPILYLPLPEDAPRFKMLDGELAAARDALTKRRQDANTEIDTWLKSVKPDDIDIDSAEARSSRSVQRGRKGDRKCGEGIDRFAREGS